MEWCATSLNDQGSYETWGICDMEYCVGNN